MMKIVAPAGNMERFHAAVKGGAHEIYMGLKGFGARRNAENFSLTEYIEALNYAHERGVRVFLTLNTVMRDAEIEEQNESPGWPQEPISKGGDGHRRNCGQCHRGEPREGSGWTFEGQE